MGEVKYPAKKTQSVFHNGKDVYHFVETGTNQVTTSGQPTMENFEKASEVKAKFEAKMTEDMKVEYDVAIAKEVKEAEVIKK